MPRIDPALVPALSALARGLRDLGVPFGVVGALVPELLLDAGPARMTNDADVAVVVATLADFESLKDRLADYGFARHVPAASDASPVYRAWWPPRQTRA